MLARMVPLARPLLTPRLRIEPVTPRLAHAARQGGEAFARALGADAPADWCASSLGLVARAASVTAAPIRAVAVHKSDGAVVGDVRFEPCGACRVEIGYSVAAHRRRQGFAVEATGAVIDWLFAEAGAETLVAGCDPRNLASINTLRRLGFRLDICAKNAFWWLLTEELRDAAKA